MSKLSFVEKLNILFKTSINSKLLFIFLALLIFIGIFLFKTNKKNEKTNKIIYCVTTLLILLIVVLSYHESIGKMITYMMNNFFIVAFFPNLAIYMAALIATNIIMWISVFNNKIPRFIRNINVTIYCSMTYLLILTLNIIKENNLDVFIQSSVYGNKTAQALIELSSTIFVIWIMFLILYKLIKPCFYKQRQNSAEILKQQVQVIEQRVMAPTMSLNKQAIDNKIYREIEAPTIVFGNNNKVRFEKDYRNIEIPTIVFGNNIKLREEKNYHGIETPAMVIGNNQKLSTEKSYIKIEAPRVVFANTNTIKVGKTVEQTTKLYDDLLTLEDYKLLLSILKEQKQKEQQEKERKARINKEQAKFHELQQLYLNTNPTSF